MSHYDCVDSVTDVIASVVVTTSRQTGGSEYSQVIFVKEIASMICCAPIGNSERLLTAPTKS